MFSRDLLCISLTSIDHNQWSHEEPMSHLPLWVKLSGISDSPALSSLHTPATELPHLRVPEEMWTSDPLPSWLWPHFLHTSSKLRGPNSCVSSTQKHTATHSWKPDPYPGHQANKKVNSEWHAEQQHMRVKEGRGFHKVWQEAPLSKVLCSLKKKGGGFY